MSHTITVIAATLDEKKLTLYKPDGTTFEIPQGDARVAKLVPIIMPKISAREPVDVDVSIEADRNYAKLEEKTNGLVRFFRVARSKLKDIFGRADEEKEAAEIAGFEYTGQSAVEEIMANAVSCNSPEFQDVIDDQKHENTDRNVQRTDGDTIVAVVGGAVIPDAQHIKHQIDHEVQTGSTGVEAFYKRMGAVAHKRRHSAQDLMKFCQKGDLHFADDGSILIYKALTHNTINGVKCITDIHSGKVPQKVGSHVFMNESLVDPNRSNECSNGLHVARRQYVGSFSGDVLTLCKVAPEDVIAVPEYDANKMRVCGYHILFVFSAEDRNAIRANKPIKTEEGKKILAAAIKGDHVGVLQTVEIRGHKGTNLLITDLVEGQQAEAVVRQSVENLEKHQPVEALNALDRTSAPKGAVLDLKEIEEQAEAAASGSRKEQAESLYQQWVDSQNGDSAFQTAALAALLDFKKKTKASWDKLGVPNDGKKPTLPKAEGEVEALDEDLTTSIMDAHEAYMNAAGDSPEELVAIKELVRLWDLDAEQVEAVLDGDILEDDIDSFRVYIADSELDDTPVPVAAAKAFQKASEEASFQFKTKADQIRHLINLGLTPDRARQISAIKTGAKKGWSKLGVSDLEVKQIENLL